MRWGWGWGGALLLLLTFCRAASFADKSLLHKAACLKWQDKSIVPAVAPGEQQQQKASHSLLTHHVRNGAHEGVMLLGCLLDVAGQVDCQGMGSFAIQQPIGQLLGVVPVLGLYLETTVVRFRVWVV